MAGARVLLLWWSHMPSVCHTRSRTHTHTHTRTHTSADSFGIHPPFCLIRTMPDLPKSMVVTVSRTGLLQVLICILLVRVQKSCWKHRVLEQDLVLLSDLHWGNRSFSAVVYFYCLHYAESYAAPLVYMPVSGCRPCLVSLFFFSCSHVYACRLPCRLMKSLMCRAVPGTDLW